MIKQSKKSIYKPLIIGVLIGIVAFSLLEVTGVVNLIKIHKSTSNETGQIESASPTNTVDYSPPKAEDTVTVPEKSTNPEPAQSTSIPSDISAIITSTRQSGDKYLIKAIITGSDNASCSATMVNGTSTATATSGAEIIEGQYSCKDLSIPMSQLTNAGDWQLSLTVTDKSGNSNTVTQDVRI